MNTTYRDGYKNIAILDLAEKGTLAFSYFLRAFGFALFTGLFIVLTRFLYPHLPTTVETYLNIALPNLPGIVSILLAAASVIAVLALHELVHATVFYLDQRIPAKIGGRGLLIFASAPGYLVGRTSMIINALAPFIIISALGFLLIALVSENLLSWIFISTVANAAAAGGDFIAVAWLLKQPKNVRIEDTGDVLTAYQA
ncbi:MAG: DUF3267 domain-containing protein [Chloroflexi bacterium]|nr:DUF3267 domain-containing protein [Chloroflexota bacterium]